MPESLRRQISSPIALFVFEATARCGSFGAAALELNVTQPSVSYQIKNLEKHLGTRLFDRRGRNIVLTEDGETLFKSVERGFASIQTGLAEIARRSSGNLVTLCSSTSAAAHFFVPRLWKARKALPELDLSLKIVNRDVNPLDESGDFAIRLGGGEWDQLDAWRLFDEVYFPLCAPDHLRTLRQPVTLETLKTSNLLFLKEQYRARDDWRSYFERAGSPLSGAQERIVFSDQQALLAAAVEGQGVGLGWLGMTDTMLASGSLVKPIDIEIRTGRSFYLVAPQGGRRTRLGEAFRDWLLQEGEAIQSRWETKRSTIS